MADPTTPGELEARLTLGKAKADADLLRAAVGSSPYVDVAILMAFMAISMMTRYWGDTSANLQTLSQALFMVVLVFHFRTKHRIDCLLAMLERRGALTQK